MTEPCGCLLICPRHNEAYVAQLEAQMAEEERQKLLEFDRAERVAAQCQRLRDALAFYHDLSTCQAARLHGEPCHDPVAHQAQSEP